MRPPPRTPEQIAAAIDAFLQLNGGSRLVVGLRSRGACRRSQVNHTRHPSSVAADAWRTASGAPVSGVAGLQQMPWGNTKVAGWLRLWCACTTRLVLPVFVQSV